MKNQTGISIGRRMLSLMMVLLMAIPWVSAPAMAASDWTELQISVSWLDGSGNTQSAYAMPIEWSQNNAFWVQVTNDAPLDNLTLNIAHPSHPDYGFAPGSGTVLPGVKNAKGLDSDAVYISAFSGDQQADSYVLYISTAVVPQEPEATPVPKASVPVNYVDADTQDTLYNTSVEVEYGSSVQVSVDTGNVSADYELNDSDTKTASVDENGNFQAVVFLFKKKAVEPINVPIYYKDSETQDTLFEDSVSVKPGDSKQVSVDTGNVSADYELNDSDSKSAVVNADGSYEPVVFLFKKKAVEPISVPIYYKDSETQDTLFEDSVSVKPGDSKQVSVDTGNVSADYELNDSDSKSAVVNADGSYEPVVFLFKKKAVEPINVPIYYKDSETQDTLFEDSVSVKPGDSKQVSVNVGNVSDDYELNDSDSKSAVVNSDGSYEPVVFLFKKKAVEPISVPIYYKDSETQDTLFEESISVKPGDSKQVSVNAGNVSADYELNDSDSKSAVVNADGSYEPVVFWFKKKAVQPTEVNVDILYKAPDGSILYQTSVGVLPGASKDVTVDTDKVSADYELDDAATKTASVREDGTFDAVTFQFKAKAVQPTEVNVDIFYTAPDGSILYQTSIAVLPGAGKDVNVDTSKVSADYELNDTATKTASVRQDGTFDPVVFQFKAKAVQPTEVNVDILYKAPDGSVLYQTSIAVLPGASKDVTVDTSKVSADYELDDAATKSASVRQDGTFDAVTFQFKAKAVQPTEVAVAILYKAPDGSNLYQTSINVLPGGSKDVTVDTSKVSADYELNDAATKTASVRQDGTFDAVTFQFKAKAVQPTEVAVTILYKAPDGSNLYQTSINVLPGASKNVDVDTSKVSADYVLDDATTKTASVRQDGTFDAVTFQFKAKPAATPTETPIPVGSPIDRWSTTVSQVNFRSTPVKANNNAIKSLPKDTYVWMYESQLNEAGEVWTRVRVDGQDGYIMTEYLQMMTKAESDQYQGSLSTPMPTRSPAPNNTATPTATVTVTPSPLPAQYQGYALTTRQVALRVEVSNSDQSILATLPTNTLVNVVGQVYSGTTPWSLVTTVTDVSGYVPDDALRRINQEEAKYYLDQLKPSPTVTAQPTATPNQQSGYAATLGDNVPMRGAANPNSSLVNMLAKGVVVFVSGQEYFEGTAWHIVQYKGQWGYIRADQLRWLSQAETDAYLNSLKSPTPTPGSVTPPPVSPSSPSSYGYVNKSGVNFRATPGSNGTRISVLNKYAFALVLGSTQVDGKTWYKVNQAGKEGYISGDFFHVLTLAELEEFLQSPEYTQGTTGGNNNNNNNNNTGNNGGSSELPTSPEDWNVGTWTNPNSGLNATYEPFDPFATPDPLPTASPSPTPEPFLTMPPPTDPPVETQTDSPSLLLPILGVMVLAGFGGLYAYALHKSNQRKAAARAAQRRAAMQQNPQSGARPYARATNAPMVPPAAGTQTKQAPPTGAPRPQAPGGAPSPYSQRPTQPPAGNGQYTSGTRPVQPGSTQMPRPSQQAGPYARPQQPGTPSTANKPEVQGDANAQNGVIGQNGAYNATSRQPRAGRHPGSDQNVPTDTNQDA